MEIARSLDLWFGPKKIVGKVEVAISPADLRVTLAPKNQAAPIVCRFPLSEVRKLASEWRAPLQMVLDVLDRNTEYREFEWSCMALRGTRDFEIGISLRTFGKEGDRRHVRVGTSLGELATFTVDGLAKTAELRSFAEGCLALLPVPQESPE